MQSEAVHYMRMICVNQVDIASTAVEVQWTQQSNNGKPLIATMQFISTANTTNSTVYVQLTADQRKEVACAICEISHNEKDRVWAMDGSSCEEQTAAVATTTTNTTTRRLQTTNGTNQTEYFMVMPNLFRADGSLEGTKNKLEATEFKQSLLDNAKMAGVSLNSIIC